MRNPREELYFSLLDASTNTKRFAAERFRLFTLLSQIVAQERTHEAQEECALCAAALLSGDTEEATRSAARLASNRYGGADPAIQALPGQPRARRNRAETILARREGSAPGLATNPVGDRSPIK